jgi:hypothetical protein
MFFLARIETRYKIQTLAIMKTPGLETWRLQCYYSISEFS